MEFYFKVALGFVALYILGLIISLILFLKNKREIEQEFEEFDRKQKKQKRIFEEKKKNFEEFQKNFNTDERRK